jgi:hypothetical protein
VNIIITKTARVTYRFDLDPLLSLSGLCAAERIADDSQNPGRKLDIDSVQVTCDWSYNEQGQPEVDSEVRCWGTRLTAAGTVDKRCQPSLVYPAHAWTLPWKYEAACRFAAEDGLPYLPETDTDDVEVMS